MNCKAVLDKLTLVAEGELPAQEMLVLRAHLAECATCGATYREVTRLVEDLRALPRPRPPADLRLRIGVALDAVEEAEAAEKARRPSPWETVGPYLAAAAVIAIAFALVTVVSRPRSGGQVARAPSSLARPADRGSITTVEAPGIGNASPGMAGSQSPDERAEAAVREANRRIRDLQAKAAMKGGDQQALWPDDMAPGRAPGEAASGRTGEPPGTRSGTFSVTPGAGGGPTIAVPSVPTQIDVYFRPPEDPVVGATVQGVVEVSAREGLPRVVVTATGDEGLKIDKPGGMLYSGPLPAGETLRVPVPMVASEAGLHEIEINVQSDAPGGTAQLKAFVPNFRGEPAPRAQPSPADTPVNLVFKNAPVRQALMDIAGQAGLRLEMAEGLGAERITQDVRGVPARAALRTVAEEGGYQVEEVGGVFRITRAAPTDNH